MDILLNVRMETIKEYNSKNKTILFLNDNLIAICSGKKRAGELVKYAYTGDEEYCKDGKIRKLIDKIVDRKLQEA